MDEYGMLKEHQENFSGESLEDIERTNFIPDKEDMFLGFANLDLKGIRNWAEEIAGEWNGDKSRSQEDRATQANEIIEKVDELIELINGMDEL